MEGLPRTPQPGERRAVNRAEQPAYRQPEEPRPVVEYPKVSPRSGNAGRANTEKNSSKKGLIWTISIIALVIVLAIIGWLVFATSKNATTGIDSSKYQSVYLMNGQIYFGKLSAQGDEFKLTNVYYLQTPAADAATGGEADTSSSEENKAQLIIKLTKAIYDPEDEMIISKDQVLYFQNLKADSRASQLIENDKS